MIRLVLRGLAILIAVAGVIDPAVTTARRGTTELAIVATDPSQEALAARAAAELADHYTILRAPFAAAAGTVLVGDRIPAHIEEQKRPLFVLLPDSSGAAVRIEAIDAPAVGALDARLPLVVHARTSGAKGQRLEITLRAQDVIVARQQVAVSDTGVLRLPLSYVPTALGPAHLRVTARLVNRPDSVYADVLADVRDGRWAVFFHDARPSWQSTFVRRVLERDARFAVTSRVVTSRSVSALAGPAPVALDQSEALAPFDVIAVGAPEALTSAEVAGLERFLRERGGSVLLLLDQNAGGAFERLVGVTQWSSAIRTPPSPIGGLLASRLRWPARLPPGAAAVAATGRGGQDPVIWQTPVGTGHLVVSGALDAWQFRDPATSQFEQFWTEQIATAATAAVPPIAIESATSILRPGEEAVFMVTLRAAALADRGTRQTVGAIVSARLDREPLALWPTEAAGRFRGRVRAPMQPGNYRVIVEGQGARAEAPIVVRADARVAAPAQHDLLSALSASRGGAVVRNGQVGELARTLEAALVQPRRRTTWHPMRSPWWILPFALLLAGEWWLARRTTFPGRPARPLPHLEF